MTEEIKSGDYVMKDGVFTMLDGEDALLQSVCVLLQCPRGRLYADKNFGSSLQGLSELAPADRVLAMARQAVAMIDGVSILSARIKDRKIRFTLLLNNMERQVCVAV